MSRYIDLTKPVSEDDRAWLMEQGRYGDLRVVDDLEKYGAAPQETVAVVPAPPVPAEDKAEAEVPSSDPEYRSWSNEQLRFELEQRGLKMSGSKQDLVARLIESDNQQ